MGHLVKLNKQENIFGQGDYLIFSQIKYLVKLDKQKCYHIYVYRHHHSYLSKYLVGRYLTTIVGYVGK
jgi:hypothetical protein